MLPEVRDHPRLLVDVFALELPEQATSPESLLSQLSVAPAIDDAVKAAVRNLLRSGGFKPTGRSKPASEYLARACEEGRLGGINLPVDLCNVVSLHSGLPISVVDLDLVRPPLFIDVVREKTAYVFNPSGQELDVTGLVCLHDADGPCGSPVKDSQRTKTHPETRRTLTVIWGDRELPGEVARAGKRYRELAESLQLKLI